MVIVAISVSFLLAAMVCLWAYSFVNNKQALQISEDNEITDDEKAQAQIFRNFAAIMRKTAASLKGRQ